MTWTAPTYLDDFPATAPGALIRCGRCPRRVHPDMLNNVTGLDVALRQAGETYWCDACREAAFGSGAIDRETYYEALGAPAPQLAELRRRLAADPYRTGRTKQAIAPGRLGPSRRRPDAERPTLRTRGGPDLAVLLGEAGTARLALVAAIAVVAEVGVLTIQAVNGADMSSLIQSGVVLGVGAWLGVSFLRFQNATTAGIGELKMSISQVRQEFVGIDGRGGLRDDLREARDREHRFAAHLLAVQARLLSVQEWIAQAQFRLNLPAPGAVAPILESELDDVAQGRP